MYKSNYYPPGIRVSRIVQMYQVRELEEGQEDKVGPLLTESLYEGAIAKWLERHSYTFQKAHDIGVPYPKKWGALIGDYRREQEEVTHE